MELWILVLGIGVLDLAIMGAMLYADKRRYGRLGITVGDVLLGLTVSAIPLVNILLLVYLLVKGFSEYDVFWFLAKEVF